VKVSVTIDRAGVPDGWKDTLPIYMDKGGKPQLVAWVSVRAAHTTGDIELPAPPEKLELNANEDILALIK
jgi:hypothetical protein